MNGRLSSLLGVGFLLTGCATNPSRPAGNPATLAEVVVMHQSSAICGADSVAKVTIDGYTVASFFAGRHVRIGLDPGIHHIGTPDGNAPFNLEAGRSYFFVATPSVRGAFTTQCVDDAIATEILATSINVEPR